MSCQHKSVVAIFHSDISGRLQGIDELVFYLHEIFRCQLVFKSLLQDSQCKITYTNMTRFKCYYPHIRDNTMGLIIPPPYILLQCCVESSPSTTNANLKHYFMEL